MGNKNNFFKGEKAGYTKDLFFNIIDSLLAELTNDDETSLNGGESVEQEEEENVYISNPKKLFEQCKNEIEEKI